MRMAGCDLKCHVTMILLYLCGVFTVLLMICLALDHELLSEEVLFCLRVKHDVMLCFFCIQSARGDKKKVLVFLSNIKIQRMVSKAMYIGF